MTMNTETTTLLVIGGGPGGYVAAIRAGQLGIPTVLVEGEDLGGTCLNIGCIPSKALIHAADAFHQAAGYAGESPLGIRTGAPTIDVTQTVAWKDGIVKRLTGGVGALAYGDGVRVAGADQRPHCHHVGFCQQQRSSRRRRRGYGQRGDIQQEQTS